MTGDFAGRVVLVTGGAKGLGGALSRHFAGRGAHVIVNHFHSRQAARQVCEEITGSGGSCEAVWASVAKKDHVARMFGAVAERHGGLDVLVNNAAAGAFDTPDAIDDVYWQRAFDTNVMGMLRCSLAAAQLMTGRPHPAIVSLSSAGAAFVVDGYAAVASMKTAMETVTRYLAWHLAPHGVQVNAVAPGYVPGGVVENVVDAEAVLASADIHTPTGKARQC